MTLLLLPGDLVCNLMGLPQDSDHRQILRTFLNTLFWGAVGSATMLWAFT
jgi:hypothetical protein